MNNASSVHSVGGPPIHIQAAMPQPASRIPLLGIDLPAVKRWQGAYSLMDAKLKKRILIPKLFLLASLAETKDLFVSKWLCIFATNIKKYDCWLIGVCLQDAVQFDGGCFAEELAILLAWKGSGSMSVLPPEAPYNQRIDEIQGTHSRPRRCFGGDL